MRVSDNTITMRVKLVSITISAGAIASTVSNKMMTTLWFGFWSGCLGSVPPARLPRSIEIEPLPSAPVAPVRRRRSQVSGVVMSGAVIVGRGDGGRGGAAWRSPPRRRPARSR